MSKNQNNLLKLPEESVIPAISAGDLFSRTDLSDKEHLNRPEPSDSNWDAFERGEDRLDLFKPDNQDEVNQDGERPADGILEVTRRHFQYNDKVMEYLKITDLPPRYPRIGDQSESKEGATDTVEPEIEEARTDNTGIGYSRNQLAPIYIKYWNNFINVMNDKKSSYYLVKYAAGYDDFTIDDAFSSINSDLLKPYCGKERYQNVGAALFPTRNQFTKIEQRSLAKLDAAKLIEYYMDEENQCIRIPYEFTSTLSRSFRGSYDMNLLTGACNKIPALLNFNSNIEDLMHPLSTMGYKASIEQEVMPAYDVCLMDNFSKISELVPDKIFRNKHIQNTLYNYVYISHIFDRSDLWVDYVYVKMWHYARSFCDKVQFNNRAIPEFVLITKDTVFRYLLECSVNICTHIKLWIMNEEGATYFRCWCGQKAYNKSSEARMIKRLSIGSSKLMHAQLNLQTKKACHNKHANDSMNIHKCPCGEQFKDHRQWMNHTFSTKIYDLAKACPIVLYNFMKLSLLTENRKFQCECEAEFGDYDFWDFWLHLCGCKTMKKAVKASCMCCNKYQPKAVKRSNSKSGKGQGASKRPKIK